MDQYETKQNVRRKHLRARRVRRPPAKGTAWWPALLAMGVMQVRVVGVYWPMRDEPDLRAFYKLLATFGIVIALPVVTNRGTMEYHSWNPAEGSPVEHDCVGIAAPVSGDVVLPEIVLSPCVAWDMRGRRLGYGGGYFDRWRGENPDVVGIAVAMEEDRIDEPIFEAYDLPFDAVATEYRLIRIKNVHDPACE